MSNGIVLSSAIRTNLLALQNTADAQSKTQERLATGKKVNSALDNASNYFTAAAFTSRSGDLSRLLDAMGNGIQTIKAATSGIDSIRKLVDNLQATARQALQAPSAFSTRASLTSNAVSNATSSDLRGVTYTPGTATGAVRTDSTTNPITGTSALNDLTGNAFVAGDTLTVNGQTISVVATGATGNNQVNVGDDVNTLLGKINAITGGTSSISGAGKITLNSSTISDLTIGGSAAAKLGFSSTPTTYSRTSAPGPLDGQVLTITVGAGPSAATKNITFGAAAGQVKTLDDLNSQLDSLGLSASVDTSGKLTVTTTNTTASKDFTVQGTAATTLFGAAAVQTTNKVRGGPGAAQRDSFLTDYNNLLKQIDTVAQDASFNGTNLLNGDDLSIIFNENNTSRLDLKGVIFNGAGLGLGPLTSSDFDDSGAINAVLGKLDGASSTLRAQASRLGSGNSVVQMRQDFTKQMINTLQVGSDNLTLADTNEEAANLLALNTRQQLSQQSLSLSNQAAQAVLRLFG